MRKLATMAAVMLAGLMLASTVSAQERPGQDIEIIGGAWDEVVPGSFDWTITGDADAPYVEAEDARASGQLSLELGPVTAIEGSVSATVSIQIENDAGSWTGERPVLGSGGPSLAFRLATGGVWTTDGAGSFSRQNVVRLVGNGEYEGLGLTLFFGDDEQPPWGLIGEGLSFTPLPGPGS